MLPPSPTPISKLRIKNAKKTRERIDYNYITGQGIGNPKCPGAGLPSRNWDLESGHKVKKK